MGGIAAYAGEKLLSTHLRVQLTILTKILGFAYYNHKVTIPEIRKTNNKLPPERRLPLAMFGAWLLPIGIFGFGATGTISIHWIAPILMSCFFSAGAFLLFQGVLNYLRSFPFLSFPFLSSLLTDCLCRGCLPYQGSFYPCRQRFREC